MKKIFLIMALLSVSLFSACGNSEKVDGLDKRTVEITKQMIQTVDKYLDFEIDAEEASEKIDNAYDRLKPSNPENDHEIEMFYLKLQRLPMIMSSIDFSTMSGLYEDYELSEEDDELLELRNEIAVRIGIKKK